MGLLDQAAGIVERRREPGSRHDTFALRGSYPDVVIGAYIARLRRVVADGGMGRVYEGIDKQTNTRIAVKVLHNDVAKDERGLVFVTDKVCGLDVLEFTP